MAENCEHCNLDRVSWNDVVPCVYSSLYGVWNDVFNDQKDDILTVLSRDDRILYIIGVLIFSLSIQLVLAR